MPTIYPPLSIGSRARLDLFKREASSRNWVQPMTWRDVRFATLKTSDSLSPGFNGKTPVWVTFDGPQFSDKYAHDVLNLRHTGWFGDTEFQEKLYRGIVGKIPHGRYLAGYIAEDSGERVYFGAIYDDESEAARAADEHARIVAEQEDGYSQKWNAAEKLRALIEDKTQDIEKSFALRNHPKLGQKERYWTREVISDVRALREELAELEKGL